MNHDHNHEHHDHDCDCGCNDEGRISLLLDDDSELICDVIGIFSIEEDSGTEYIALVPAEEEEGDVLIYRYKEDEKGLQLENIESDEEYEAVAEVFEDLFCEAFEDDAEE